MKNIAFILLLSVGLITSCRWDNSTHKTGGNGGKVTATGKRDFDAPYKTGTQTARLELSGGACSFTLDDTTGKLFNAEVADSTRHFSLAQVSEGSVQVVRFKMADKDDGDDETHTDSIGVKLSLNANPQWEIDAKTGASSSHYDLTAFKISKLHIDCSAGAFKVKLKPVLPDMNIDLKVSVAAIDISIPADAACEVETDTNLGSNHFDGFDKKSDDHYETPGFASAKNKIHIKAKCSLAAFKILRY